jgi:hypothetical protein
MKSSIVNHNISELLQAINELSANPEKDDMAGVMRLPLKSVSFKPSDGFRLRVQKLALLTKQPPTIVFEQLVAIAAGMDVRPVQICPQNGPETGIALESVTKVLQIAQNCIRCLESKENPPADKVQALREGYVATIELLIAADKLAGETFYNHQTLVRMQAFAFKNNEAMSKLSAEIASLEKTISAGASDEQKHKVEKLGILKSNLEARKELATVLVRLGFAPEFTT